jgi:hypothetical protein
MGMERIMQYECRVCGRKIDVTRTGDIYEEPVYCCGLETAQAADVSEAPPAPVLRKRAAAGKKMKKKAKKAAGKKTAKKALKKKAAKKRAAKKTATKKKAGKRR